jgi:hypothetical protein
MTTTTKVFIVLGVCFFLGVFAVVGAGVYWWTHHSRELFQAGENAMKQGTDFGKKTDNQGCLDEALSRYRQNKGFGGAISNSLFLTNCLNESRPTSNFCDDVPRPFDFIRSAQWQIKKCEEAGLSDPYCRQLYGQVQQYCERARLKAK